MRLDSIWLVWNPERCSPSRQHTSLDSAEAEAHRLARMNPGQRFIVLESVAVYQKSDVTRIDMRHSDGVPF